MQGLYMSALSQPNAAAAAQFKMCPMFNKHLRNSLEAQPVLYQREGTSIWRRTIYNQKLHCVGPKAVLYGAGSQLPKEDVQPCLISRETGPDPR